MTVSLLAPVDMITGYGNHCAQIAQWLPRLGIDVIIRPITFSEAFGASIPEHVTSRIRRGANDCEWEIVLSPLGMAPTPGKKTIYITMCESTRLKPEHVEALNRCEVVVVPSNWCATVFSANGVRRPIVVIPLGVSEEWARPGYLRLPSKFTFACAGRYGSGPTRKGVRQVFDLFQAAFPNNPNVRLKIKLLPTCRYYLPHDERVTVTRAWMMERELVDWMRDVGCFVNFATGGFELFPLQAMAIGVPVMSFAYGGITEYFNESVGTVVPHHITDAGDVWRGLGHWAEVDEQAAVDAMRSMVTPTAEVMSAVANGVKLARRLTWENHCIQIAKLIRELTEPAVAQFNFPHGLGDCCNAATLFSMLMKHGHPRIAVHCPHDREFIFRSAGCDILKERAQRTHPWSHPPFDGSIEMWADNKTAFNSPWPMTDTLWSALKEEVVMAQPPRDAVETVSMIISRLPRPIVLLHTRGHTSGHLKNFPATIERGVVNELSKLVPSVILLNDVEMPTLPDNVIQVHSTAMMGLTIDRLCALIDQCDLLIGVDSGPLHLARMTRTKALGVWFQMNPTAFAIPSPRIRHICPWRHRNSGDQFGSADHYERVMPLRATEFNVTPVPIVFTNDIIAIAKEMLAC